MRNRTVPVFVIAAAALLIATTAVAAPVKLPPIPSMACPVIQTSQAPNIDGNLDEPAWSKADTQKQWHRHYAGLDRPQELRLLTDGKYLYVGITAYEKQIPEKDQEIVEVFIAAHRSSDYFVSYSAYLSSKGITKRNPDLPADQQDNWRAVFKQHPDRWVLEMAFRAEPIFQGPLVKGKLFNFNLGRTRMEMIGDSFDIYQQWSNTGTSSGSRYRFGEVAVGSPADRVPVIREELRKELATAGKAGKSLSSDSLKKLSLLDKQATALLSASPATGTITTAAVKEYQLKASALGHKLRTAALADRPYVVWECNAMTTPMPHDLPLADKKDVTRLDIRVLGGEWESAAVAVTNLTSETMDGQVLLSDFTSSDGKTKVPGWDVLQVRTAPMYLLHTGDKKRDPLPRLQEGDLFKVAPDQNELLWLTFKSRGLAPGKYTAKMTVRSLDDALLHTVDLVLRVYPLALGAEGRPWVNPWNNMLRGKDWPERAAHAKDYYLNVGLIQNWDELPVFTADSEGNLIDEKLDFTQYDKWADEVIKSESAMYLNVVEAHTYRFWPMRPKGWKYAGGSGAADFPIKRWSPEFNAIFRKWVAAYTEHMRAKGLPPEKWAFYIMDEPWPGEERQDILEFAKQVKLSGTGAKTYITLPIRGGTDDEQNIEVSKYLDIIQWIGQPKQDLLEQMRKNAGGLWTYNIGLRGMSHFGYRRDFCWEPMRRGELGVGFWCWDGNSQSSFLWRDDSGEGDIFAILYNDHENHIIPSMRGEAFREGIEDWKYVLMLDDAIAAAEKKGVDVSVISPARAYRTKCLSDLSDADSAYRFRDIARSHLLALHAALGDLDESQVKAVETD